ncbi:PCYCGC motif-containing (lipo)protein [Peribacillus deserti]|uniref:PCYCGC motif-containing (lipo)protein n=1 Tax=Peribacillus deserti TaxID=673318 RepID=UPI002683693D|nr:PCYCGC motif-containing (lipo)protein [Peribacillus deserti]
MNVKLLGITLGLCSSLLLSACGSDKGVQQNSGQKEEAEHESHAEHAVSGDLRQETKKGEAPDFLADKPEDMKTIYLAVSRNRELLEKIPCYCGCGDEAGHKNNYDCFVYENKENGNIVWDDHGTKCGVCLEIAAQSIVDLQKGKTIKEIRKQIDETYKNGYGEPTPTPAV